VSVIISPNFDALEKWAKLNGVATTDRAALVSDAKVQKMYKDLVGKANEGLAHHEAIKRIAVVPDEWTPESGELTPSLKLKRRVINEKYKDRISALYGGGNGE
jgi:long-chain acyl-CoA synthetase